MSVLQHLMLKISWYVWAWLYRICYFESAAELASHHPTISWHYFPITVQLPLAAYLLALIYFFLSVLSLSTLVGLRAKRTRLLLAWILFFLLCVFPEAGMVLYMAVYYWVRDKKQLSNEILSAFLILTERWPLRCSRVIPLGNQGSSQCKYRMVQPWTGDLQSCQC